ncbi:MAG TPA: hypothetical protein VM577_05545 [Anaerovoracaceae bacterium]|nr:hypothetical protein [Anaerovoracaceae bacterium]
MPITPEQAIALTDSENDMLQKTFKSIDDKLMSQYDYDMDLEINLPFMRNTVANLIVRTYQALDWMVDDNEDQDDRVLTFSSRLTNQTIPYNKPSGSPYR